MWEPPGGVSRIFKPACESSNHSVRGRGRFPLFTAYSQVDSRLYIGCETPRTVSLEGIMRGVFAHYERNNYGSSGIDRYQRKR